MIICIIFTILLDSLASHLPSLCSPEEVYTSPQQQNWQEMQAEKRSPREGADMKNAWSTGSGLVGMEGQE